MKGAFIEAAKYLMGFYNFYPWEIKRFSKLNWLIYGDIKILRYK